MSQEAGRCIWGGDKLSSRLEGRVFLKASFVLKGERGGGTSWRDETGLSGS